MDSAVVVVEKVIEIVEVGTQGPPGPKGDQGDPGTPGSGSSTGDVVGPSSSTNEIVAVFDGTTGKLLKVGSHTLAQLRDRANHTGTQLAASIFDFVPAALDAVTWTSLVGKPSTFPASTHDHNGLYYTKEEVDALISSIPGGDGGRTFDPRDFGAVVGDLFDSALPSSGVLAANKAAIQDAIDAAQAAGGGVLFSAFHWSDGGLTTHGAKCPIGGMGKHTGIGSPALAGTVLDMKVTSGYAQAPYNMTIFGQCFAMPGGAGSTTYTTVLLDVGRTSGTALHAYMTRVQLLGGYTGVRLLNASWAHVRGNKIQHQRGEGILVTNPASSDTGDIKIESNELHVANVGSPGYAASVCRAIRVTSCAGLYVKHNKVFCQSDAAFEVNLSEAAYDDGGTIVQIAHLFEGNEFDSSGVVPGSSCIRYRSSYGTGGSGSSLVGNTLRDLKLVGNIMSNCVNLLDLEGAAGAFEDVTVFDNSGSGGGGLKFRGVVTRLKIAENNFNADGSSFAPSTPIDAPSGSFTATFGDYHDNEFTGYALPPDLTDEVAGGIADATPAVASVSTTGSGPAVATVTPAASTAPQRALVVVDEATRIDLSGLTDGDDLQIVVAQQGDGNAVTWGPAPSDFQFVNIGTITFGAVDDHVDLVTLRVREGLIIRSLESLGVVADFTSDPPPPGGTLVFHEEGGTPSGAMGGTLPNTVDNGNNWIQIGPSGLLRDGSSFATFGAPSDNAANGGTVDVETVHQKLEITVTALGDGGKLLMNCDSSMANGTGIELYSGVEDSWYWLSRSGGTVTYHGGGNALTIAVGDKITLETDPDDTDVLILRRNDVIVGSRDYGTRLHKTNENVGIQNGYSGRLTMTIAKGYSL